MLSHPLYINRKCYIREKEKKKYPTKKYPNIMFSVIDNNPQHNSPKSPKSKSAAEP